MRNQMENAPERLRVRSPELLQYVERAKKKMARIRTANVTATKWVQRTGWKLSLIIVPYYKAGFHICPRITRDSLYQWRSLALVSAAWNHDSKMYSNPWIYFGDIRLNVELLLDVSACRLIKSFRDWESLRSPVNVWMCMHSLWGQRYIDAPSQARSGCVVSLSEG